MFEGSSVADQQASRIQLRRSLDASLATWHLGGLDPAPIWSSYSEVGGRQTFKDH